MPTVRTRYAADEPTTTTRLGHLRPMVPFYQALPPAPSPQPPPPPPAASTPPSPPTPMRVQTAAVAGHETGSRGRHNESATAQERDGQAHPGVGAGNAEFAFAPETGAGEVDFCARPFVTDTAVQFPLQDLAAASHQSKPPRAKINFLEQLYVWHQQQGNLRVSVPTINNKPLDLYQLRKENLPHSDLKNSYTRVILPFEVYETKNAAKKKQSPPKKPANNVNASANGASPSVNGASTSANGTNGTNGEEKRARSASAITMDISPPDSPLTSTSSPLSEPPEDGANGSKMAGPSTLVPSPIPPPVFHDTKVPEVKRITEVDEGDEHSLSSFQARDTEFRRVWFESHPPTRDPDVFKINDPTTSQIGNVTVSEYDLENEFWRLVNTQDETVEVEYGADVHSTTHGSAMPTMETHPLNPYSNTYKAQISPSAYWGFQGIFNNFE
ncbi:hypothetical protein K438DRAFT_1984241 [Mycena galopus ATCC 62051]|nr:hypothetical protein K438DRAFT_1984241 [Mycena galopus ATCC 62051]